MIETFIFYMYATILVASAVMVISARNPVHSVLFLILCFFNAAGLFVLLGAEFLAMVLVVVYVGAVAVLFLFVVMMLDINLARAREGMMAYLPTGAVVGLVLLAELVVVFSNWGFAPHIAAEVQAPMAAYAHLTNTDALGHLLYTRYVYLFQISGLLLLVAMVGTILLTLRRRPGVRKQTIADQVARSSRSVEVRKVPTGGGV